MATSRATHRCDTGDETTAPQGQAPGKRQLLDSAGDLLASQSSSDALALRALARHAGLNHNTFYRHFSDRDQLLVALMEEYSTVVRAGIRSARAASGPQSWPTAHVVGWILTAAQNRAALFQAAYRVLHGPPNPARRIVENTITTIAREMSDDLAGELPNPSARQLFERLLSVYVRHVFDLTIAFVEGEISRRRVLADCQQLLVVLVAGTTTAVEAKSPWA